MRVRKMDADGDMVFGGQESLWKDVPDAVAQVAMTRLQLYQGEWFLDTTSGTPWRTKVLGKHTAATRDPVIRARILGTPGVTGISSYSSTLNRDTRTFTINAVIDTIYGKATIQGTL